MRGAIIDWTAGQIAEAVANGTVSAAEVTEAFLARIDAVNPVINAVCTVNPEALEHARAVDRRRAAGEAARPLEGVPFLVKDILQTKGLRTTFGSLLLEHDVPEEDTITVERLKAAGGVLLGKTNTPEFAHDINTTNKIFGTTRNPWDVNVTAGGSSGGSGAAVAAGMAPLALGTDLGGSIRIPCSFNNLAGLRPSPGRVPFYPTDYGWDTLVQHVQGPMTRDVGDVGLAMSVLAGPDDRDPSSLPDEGHDYRAAASGRAAMAGRRVAYAGDLGVIPLDPEVDGLIRNGLARLESLGCVIEDACFDTSDIREVVSGTRAFGMVARYADRFDAHKSMMTQQLINQITPSLEMSLRDVTRAEKLRTAYWHRVRRFMERYEFIAAACVGAPPFRLDEPLPTTVGGKPVARFQDVFLSTYVFSVTGLPMVAMPCGLTRDGRPVGMQIIARRLRDDSALEIAAAYQSVAGELFRRPEIDLDAVKPVSEAMQTPGVSIDKK
jgi:amidase